MAMRTLKEIDDAEAAARERAHTYQVLIEERDLLVRAVNKLQPQIDDVSGVEALSKIAKLAGQVPERLTTRGSAFVPSNFQAREVLATTAVNALQDLERHRAELVSTLEKVRQRQATNAERLKEFDE